MANPFVRGWKYFLALLSGKLDEHADPRIQIQQAIEEAQHSHQRLTQQAAAGQPLVLTGGKTVRHAGDVIRDGTVAITARASSTISS